MATVNASTGTINTTGNDYLLQLGMDSANSTVSWYDLDKSSANETLDELNIRYAHKLLPFTLILGLLCFIGIVGNSIVIMVFLYSREYRNTNFKIFVLCLAFVDLMSSITLLPAEMVKTRHFFLISDHVPCKVKCFFNIFAMNASAYILLVICIDRYRKVCQPLKKQIWPSLAIKILVGAVLLSFLFSIPAPILCGVTEHLKNNFNGANITVYVCSAEKKYHHSVFRYTYKFGLSVLLVIIAVALIVMYVMIMRVVIKHWGKRESGETIRFDTSRTPVQSADKVEIERLTENGDAFLNIKTIEGEAHVNAYHKVCLNGSEMNRKINEETKRLRSPSTNSMSSMKGRFSVKRSSSDVSFRARIMRRKSSSGAAGRLPYKTLIWFVLTLIFLVTFIINAVLSFMTTGEYQLSPTQLFWYLLFFRIYFINNIINPIIYAWLDKRFKRSLKNMLRDIKEKFSGY